MPNYRRYGYNSADGVRGRGNANRTMYGRNRYGGHIQPIMNSPNMQARARAYNQVMASRRMTPVDEFTYKLRQLVNRYMGQNRSMMQPQRSPQPVGRGRSMGRMPANRTAMVSRRGYGRNMR